MPMAAIGIFGWIFSLDYIFIDEFATVFILTGSENKNRQDADVVQEMTINKRLHEFIDTLRHLAKESTL